MSAMGSDHNHDSDHRPARVAETAVLDVRGPHRATERLVIEAVLGRLPGVQHIDANPVAQTATVTCGPAEMSVAELRTSIERCGCHCDGRSVPGHLCEPMAETSRSKWAVTETETVSYVRDPLDLAVALQIGRGTVRKMRQNLGWAIWYNAIALPIAAGVFETTFGLVLRPEIAALTMPGSTFLVAVNAVLLKRLRLPAGRPLARTRDDSERLRRSRVLTAGDPRVGSPLPYGDP